MIAGGVIAILGGIGVIVACAVPLIKGPASAGFGSTSLSLFSLLSHGPKWLFAEPIGIAVLSVVAGLIIIASHGRVAPAVAAGILIGIGIQTVAVFYAVHAIVSKLVSVVTGLGSLSGSGSASALALGIQTGPAGMIGILGGVLLVVAGIVAALAARRA